MLLEALYFTSKWADNNEKLIFFVQNLLLHNNGTVSAQWMAKGPYHAGQCLSVRLSRNVVVALWKYLPNCVKKGGALFRYSHKVPCHTNILQNNHNLPLTHSVFFMLWWSSLAKRLFGHTPPYLQQLPWIWSAIRKM